MTTWEHETLNEKKMNGEQNKTTTIPNKKKPKPCVALILFDCYCIVEEFKRSQSKIPKTPTTTIKEQRTKKKIAEIRRIARV